MGDPRNVLLYDVLALNRKKAVQIILTQAIREITTLTIEEDISRSSEKKDKTTGFEDMTKNEQMF